MSGVKHARDRTVRTMFDRIAGRYDLLNSVISFRLDKRWRRKVIREVVRMPEPRVLDIGTGTGDLVFDALKITRGKGSFVGLDFSQRMLRLAQAKRPKFSSPSSAAFVLADAMTVPFRSNAFDGVMSAFVLRNVSDVSLLFAEAFRILKPGGVLVTLDMFPPPSNWFSPLYSIYFHHLMPRIGALLAHDRAAYQYLSESVRQFEPPDQIARLIEQAGFERVLVQKFLFGAVCMHVANKPNPIAFQP